MELIELLHNLGPTEALRQVRLTVKRVKSRYYQREHKEQVRLYAKSQRGKKSLKLARQKYDHLRHKVFFSEKCYVCSKEYFRTFGLPI